MGCKDNMQRIALTLDNSQQWNRLSRGVQNYATFLNPILTSATQPREADSDSSREHYQLSCRLLLQFRHS